MVYVTGFDRKDEAVLGNAERIRQDTHQRLLGIAIFGRKSHRVCEPLVGLIVVFHLPPELSTFELDMAILVERDRWKLPLLTLGGELAEVEGVGRRGVGLEETLTNLKHVRSG